MKKNILTALLMSLAVFVSAQTEYDALRLSETDIVGSARYMSMGGAFGSLGGDASALKDNPAGLGVFRSSEISGTLNFSLNSLKPVEWYGKTTNQETYSKLNFNNFSYIVAGQTGNDEGLISSNISFTYTKLKDYNKKFYMEGGVSGSSFIDHLLEKSNGIPGAISYDNFDMPWLTVLGFDGYLLDTIPGTLNFYNYPNEGGTVNPTYLIDQTGTLSELSFGWGGNYNNRLFIGANLNIRSLDYSLYSIYSEDFQLGGDFDIKNVLNQDGIGINAKLGLIYLPTNNLRVGFAFHTPSYMYISEKGYADMNSSYITSTAETPINEQSFKLWNPLQLQASASYLFGKKGLLSAEYNFINYKGARFNTTKESTQLFSDINAEMKNVLNDVHVLKLGAEAKLTPNISLRGGYAMMTPSVNSNYTDGKLLVNNSVSTNTEYANQFYNTTYTSFGIGYREAGWFIDLGYNLKTQKEDFYPYQDQGANPATITTNTNNVMLTLGFKM